MNQHHLNTSIYDIALNIGVSLDVKQTVNSAITSYLRQLNCLGVVLYKKENEEFNFYTSKPKTLKKDTELQGVAEQFFEKIDMVQREYCAKQLPYVIEQNELIYTFYPLPGFGILLFISNVQLSDVTTAKALFKLNEKFANSIIASLQHEQLMNNEKLMYQQSKMASMGEMIANIAHQWRQPLSAISTLSTGLKVELDLGISTNEDISTKLIKINDISQHLSSTIEDFRNFFQEDGLKENFSIQDAIDDSLKIIDANLKASEIVVLKQLNIGEFYGNKNGIKQSFINIFNNAKDALVEKNIENKVIFISLSEDNDYFQLDIVDNAGGIPSDIMPKIFEPYFTTKHQSQGTGIGLYMTKEILEKQSNCSIEVSNTNTTFEEYQLEGAKFTIKFPKDNNDT